MTDVWVTGARGFIGRYAARALAQLGYRVHGIGHGAWSEADRQAWDVHGWFNSQITAAGLDTLASESGAPAVIMHLAGGSSVGVSMAAPLEDFTRTVSATAELLEWVRTRSPVTVIVAASSAAVYGDNTLDRISCQALVRPCSPYGAHKVAMEYLLCGHARSFGIKIAILRLFSVYGPGLEKQLIWDLCTRLARGDAVLKMGGTGSESRDFVFVEDAARMLVAAIGHASVDGAVFNAGTGIGLTVHGLVDAVLAAWPAAPVVQFSGVSRAGDPYSLIADMRDSSAIRPIIWTTMRDGMAQTVSAAQRRIYNSG